MSRGCSCATPSSSWTNLRFRYHLLTSRCSCATPSSGWTTLRLRYHLLTSRSRCFLTTSTSHRTCQMQRPTEVGSCVSSRRGLAGRPALVCLRGWRGRTPCLSRSLGHTCYCSPYTWGAVVICGRYCRVQTRDQPLVFGVFVFVCLRLPLTRFVSLPCLYTGLAR